MDASRDAMQCLFLRAVRKYSVSARYVSEQDPGTDQQTALTRRIGYYEAWGATRCDLFLPILRDLTLRLKRLHGVFSREDLG
jgi:hypothetical protein